MIDKLRERYRQTRSSENDLDENIIPILDLLNKLDGVATTFSCGGHEGYYYEDPWVTVRRRSFPHVICAVTRAGYQTLIELFDKMINNKEIRSENLQYSITFQIANLKVPLELNIDDDYLAIVIKFKTTNSDHIECYFKVFTKFLNQLILEQ